MTDTFASIRAAAAEANRHIAASGLVMLAFGNASAADLGRGVFAIKPSGVPCERMRPEDAVVVSIEDGSIVAGSLRPSSDEPTHRVLYQRLGAIGGIVHTHSPFATAWAQAGRAIPCLGTTHADHFRGEVPVTRALTDAEVRDDYEWNTGLAVTELYGPSLLDPAQAPGCLVRSHGPFVWGADAAEAAMHAEAVEAIAAMASHTIAVDPAARPLGEALLARHFDRKHGANAYYGQAPGGGPPRG